MRQITKHGIDYALGQANIDSETGIRYGVIAQNTLKPDCLSDFEYDYGDPHCPDCGNEVEESEDNKDYVCPDHGAFWSDECFPDECLGIYFEDEEYLIVSCLDSNLMVIRSPYVAHGAFCSPCVPGAVDLDSPTADGPVGYALGPEWFDADSPMPYDVQSVKAYKDAREES